MFVLLYLGCTTSQPSDWCPDCNQLPPILVTPADDLSLVTTLHTKQWKVSVGGVELPSSRVVWSTNRGIISNVGLYTAPDTPSPGGSPDWVRVDRIDGNTPPKSAELFRLGWILVVEAPKIIDFSSQTSLPVTPGTGVSLDYHFSFGTGGLYQGTTLVQSSLPQEGTVTVYPQASTVYTLKVTNQARDSVQRDLTVTVQ